MFTTNNDISYKHHVVCYLLSHINACSSEFAQTRLLNCIAMIPHKAKSQILLPAIQALTEKATATQPTDIFATSSEKLTIQLLSCFHASAAHFNENSSAWNLFLLAIRTYLRSGGTISLTIGFLPYPYLFTTGTPQSAQQALVRVVQGGLFSSLNQQRKIAACEALLELGSQTSSGVCFPIFIASTII
jgi:U3 small nucleolar RNA-associated protein 10